MFYSKETGGFYDRSINGDDIPTDAKEISKEEYRNLLIGQNLGKKITSDVDGVPFLSFPPGDFYTTKDGKNWEFDIESAKSATIKDIEKQNKQMKDGGFEVEGTLFCSDESATVMYLTLAHKFNEDPAYKIMFPASPGVWVEMDKDLLGKVITALHVHIADCLEWQFNTENQAKGCNSKEDLDVVSVKLDGKKDKLKVKE